MNEDSQNYLVRWTKASLNNLFSLFNVDHDQVFLKSKTLLSLNPYIKAVEIDGFPGFRYNGYYWIVIHNVILVYSVDDANHVVRIRACYSALTGFALRVFNGEYDPSDN